MQVGSKRHCVHQQPYILKPIVYLHSLPVPNHTKESVENCLLDCQFYKISA